MKIIAYQYDDGVYRFIYQKENSEHYNVASAENMLGFRDFIIYSGAELLDNSVNIYGYAKDLVKTN